MERIIKMIIRGKLLLVDDEPLVLDMFQSFFLTRDFDVHIAPNSREALKSIEKSHFDVIICDVMLEDLDGFDLLSIARRRNSTVKFILITGSPSEKDANRAEELNASYLTKPVGFEVILETVESSINNSIYSLQEQIDATKH